MKRKIYADLIAWKDNSNRRPLLLSGSRKVGKSYILQEFAKKEFDNYIIVDLEANKSIFDRLRKDPDPSKMLKYLETAYSQKLIPGSSLIIFEEVQASSKKVQILAEAIYSVFPEYHIVATGSMVGFTVNGEDSLSHFKMFDKLTLYSMDFEEFLWACNRASLADTIRAHYNSNEPLVIHSVAFDFYNQYLIVGGLPTAVEKYVTTYDFSAVAEIQNMVLEEYKADIAKYAPFSESDAILSCYSAIIDLLKRKNRSLRSLAIIYGSKIGEFEKSLEWLKRAGIFFESKKSLQGSIPIKSHKLLGDFRYFMSDVGLLTLLSGISSREILSVDGCQNKFMGSISENCVAHSLATRSIPLVYWRGHNTADIDFIIERDGDIVPLEVNYISSYRTKSISIFMKTYKNSYSIHLSLMNFSLRDNVRTVPFYAAFCI